MMLYQQFKTMKKNLGCLDKQLAYLRMLLNLYSNQMMMIMKNNLINRYSIHRNLKAIIKDIVTWWRNSLD